MNAPPFVVTVTKCLLLDTLRAIPVVLKSMTDSFKGTKIDLSCFLKTVPSPLIPPDTSEK